MNLRKRQAEHARRISVLILYANELGYDVTLGDAYRDSRCPYGSPTSKHRMRLASDLNLFWDGEYLEDTESHRVLGEAWEAMGGEWGGRFETTTDINGNILPGSDGNHYATP